jgi:predicted RNase H-like nuclease
MSIVAGIDGCRAGWLCLLGLGRGSVVAAVLATVDDLLKLTPRPRLVLIDMPIGLPDSGPRRCDVVARRTLGRGRFGSVFSAPIRPMLAADTYERACSIGLDVDGRKISKQTWNLVPKIRELDEFVGRAPRSMRIRETHPELCFQAWNDGRAMKHSKKTVAGVAERERLIRKRFGAALDETWNSLLRSADRRGFKRDDLLDAFAALRSAERVAAERRQSSASHTGEPGLTGEPCERDSTGLPMEIVY